MPLYAYPPFPPERNRSLFFDDFLGTSYNDRVWAVTGTGSVTTIAQIGGRVRVRATAGNYYEFNFGGAPNWSVKNEARIAWYGGMVTPSGGTGGLVACGLASRVNPTNDFIRWSAIYGEYFHCAAFADGNKWEMDTDIKTDTNDHEFLIECTTDLVNFYLDGVLKGSCNTTNCITDDILQPYVYCLGDAVAADFNLCSVDVRGLR